MKIMKQHLSDIPVVKQPSYENSINEKVSILKSPIDRPVSKTVKLILDGLNFGLFLHGEGMGAREMYHTAVLGTVSDTTNTLKEFIFGSDKIRTELELILFWRESQKIDEMFELFDISIYFYFH